MSQRNEFDTDAIAVRTDCVSSVQRLAPVCADRSRWFVQPARTAKP